MQRPQSPGPEYPKPPAIAGYRDLVRVAEGGFSTVYTAYEQALGRTVAVKVLHADAQDPVARQRFQHECELTGRLTGRANIITVFAAGPTSDGGFYIAMQYLPKGSLADRLAATGPLPVAEVVRIGVAIAGALDAAHEAGILHRDIKPGNILVSDRDEPVLSDFGIASLINPDGAAKDVVAFTRGHAAPELIEGQPPSARSDVYALGSTLYTLLTGVPPTDGGAGPVGLNRPDLPAGLVALLRRTLATEPSQRPATAAEFAADLGAVLDGSPHRPPAADAAPGSVPTVDSAPTAGSGSTAGSGPAVGSAPAAGSAPVAGVPGGVDGGGAGGGVPAGEPTRLREGRIIRPGDVPVQGSGRRRAAVVAGIAAVVVVVAAGSAFAVMERSHDDHGAVAGGDRRGAAATSPSASAPGSHGATVASAPSTAPATRAGQPPRQTGQQAAPPPAAPTGPARQPTRAPAPPPKTTAAANPNPTGQTAPPTVCTSGCAAKAYFMAYGEHLFVCDEKTDGYSAVAVYTRTDVSGGPYQAVESNTGACLDHNMNMAEGAKITFKICLETDAGAISHCSGTISAKA